MHDDMRLLSLIVCIVIASLAIGFALLGDCVKADAGSDDYRITYYGDALAGNPMYCTGETYDPEDITVVATSADGFQCGTVLKVCAATCTTLTVQDRCGSCRKQHIDVSESAWYVLGGEDYGTVEPVTTTPIQLPSTGIGLEPNSYLRRLTINHAYLS